MATRPAAKATAKPTAAKAKTAPKAAAKPDPKPELAVTPDAPVMRTKDLVEAIAPNVSVKRKDLRPLMEAVFKAMGDALAEGKSLNIPPLGKILVKKERKGENADTIVLRLRRQHASVKAAESLAEDED